MMESKELLGGIDDASATLKFASHLLAATWCSYRETQSHAPSLYASIAPPLKADFRSSAIVKQNLQRDYQGIIFSAYPVEY